MVWEPLLNGVPVPPLYDDGVPGGPDDPTFTTANIAAFVAASGGAVNGYNYVGQSAADALES